ncbi:hypothetical protein [Paratractidigestivibacter sp.]|uniref:hypothetical protein n=1 Tax=Paratractidigestivibacter sp. TaxID=2847316 RepID=UPI002ACB12D5|nr:hypothetical protein [Paratractidigestivibacter sp.]
MADGSVTIEIKGDAGPIDKTLSDVGSKAKSTFSGAFDGVDADINDAADAARNLGDEFDTGGSKLSRFSDIFKGTFLGGLAAKGVELAVGAVKSLGDAAIDAGKQAVEGYAQYEQLVGGMDTLFGESSQKMQDYAADAYKTAGMSANQYMETATQFAASLIKSTGGDTAKAAEQANKAIIQMSDNANKMGTNVEDIQNAYRGFAKQNFTMLDNLSLGYAGTKEGMQELLKDAEALSGVKYDINSYSDMVDAVGVIQDAMGITGTTAAEAAGTVQGSVDSMKAAWDNWLTGLADPDADMGESTQKLAASISTALSNLLPIIGTLFSNLGSTLFTAFSNAFPQAGGILSSLYESVTGAFGRIRDAINNAFTPEQQAAIASFFEKLGQFIVAVPFGTLSAGVNAVVSTFEAFIEIGSAVVQAISAIIDWFSNFRENVSNAVSSVAEKINNWGASVVEDMTTAASNAVSAVTDWFKSLPGKIYNAIISAVDRVKEWGADVKKAAEDKFEEVKTAIVEKVEEIPEKLKEKGRELVQGLINGISEKINAVREKAGEVANTVISTVTGIFKTHSPSRVMIEIGKYVGQGLANGMEATKKVVKKAASNVANTVTKEVSKLNDEIEAITAAATKRQADKEEAEYQKNLKEKYDALTKAEVKERSKLQAEIDKLEADHNEKQLKAQEDAQKKALQSQVKSLEAIKSEYEKALSDVEKTRDDMASKLGDVDLFTEEDDFFRLTDLQKSIDAINKYGDTIQALKDRGIADSLLSEVLGLDQEKAVQYAQKLLAMGDEQYDAYMDLWREKEAAAKKVAESIYQSEIDAIEEAYADKLPEELRPAGQTAMDALTAGIVEGGKETIAAAKSIADRVLSELSRIGAAQKLKTTVQAESSFVSNRLSGSSAASRERQTANQSAQTGTLANVMSLMNSAQGKARDIVLTLNGKEVARGLIDDIRAVEDQSPRIVSD